MYLSAPKKLRLSTFSDDLVIPAIRINAIRGTPITFSSFLSVTITYFGIKFTLVTSMYFTLDSKPDALISNVYFPVCKLTMYWPSTSV